MSLTNIIRSIALLACLSFITVVAQAQEEERTPLTPEERATKWTEWMKTELSVTAEQEPKVHEINLKYAQQTESVRAQGGSRRSKFKDVKSIDDAKDEELKAVLSPEQFEQYRAKKQEMRKKVMKAARERKG
jgi:Spy/CpxP family protein refolding chaperone